MCTRGARASKALSWTPITGDRLTSTTWKPRSITSSAGSGPPDVDSPSAKLWVTRHALHARRDHPELFSEYKPLVLEGPLREHLLAFDRGGAVTLATRLPVGLGRLGGWGDATVPLGRHTFTDVFTGSRYQDDVRLAQLFHRYPVALLLVDEAPDG